MLSCNEKYALILCNPAQVPGHTLVVSKSQIVGKEVPDDNETNWFEKIRKKVNWFVIDDLNKKGKNK